MFDFLRRWKTSFRMARAKKQIAWFNYYVYVADLIINAIDKERFPTGAGCKAQFNEIKNIAKQNNNLILNYAGTLFPKTKIESVFAACHIDMLRVIEHFLSEHCDQIIGEIAEHTRVMEGLTKSHHPSGWLIMKSLELSRGRRFLVDIIILCLVADRDEWNTPKSCPLMDKLYDFY